MLRLLRIRNFALIRELEIEFDRGLNLLTGETGSGKSILVDAFGQLLGERSSQEMIRTNCDAAVVEGVFEVRTNRAVLKMLGEAGFDIEDGLLLIRREISSSGRNRIFVNDRIATLNLLKSIGENLADIHGQQDQKSLLDLSTHLGWLDHYGENSDRRNTVRERYKKLKDVCRQIELLRMDEGERLRRIDILKFQEEEISRVDPKANEREDLERESAVLANGERIVALATEVYSILYESETSVLMEARRLEHIFQELERFDERWIPHRESLKECLYRLEDMAFAARDYAAQMEFSPERLEQVQQRLYALEKLAQKYGSEGCDILVYLARCRLELETLFSVKDASERLSETMSGMLSDYLESATALSEKRRKDAARLEKAIRKEFSALAMPRMQMRIHFYPADEPTTGGGIPGRYGLDGIDHVEFLIAPNEGEEMKPLARIASGGELSRLMLAIKSVCGSEDSGKTLVFDEVDAGIGGRVAEAVGRRLLELSKTNQVLCVTHLPQIAVFAGNHFSVSKTVVDNRTETRVKPLTRAERIEEISRMLGGEVITETTRRHAHEMLERSVPAEGSRETV